MKLSQETLLAFPAKTTEDGPKRTFGISVYQHSLLAGYVLEALLGTFIKREDCLPATLVALAAAHDIGKVNPFFLRKLLHALTEGSLPAAEQETWEKLIADVDDIEEVSHPIISYAALKTLGVDKRIAVLVSMHHGYPPPNTVASDAAWQYGGPDWAQAREALFKMLMEKLEIASFPSRNADREKQKVLSDIWLGLVVVSDWIASQIEKPVPPGTEEAVAAELVRKAGFKKPGILPALSFEDIFGFPPRPAQKKLSDLYAGPGIYIFEAPTGYGKTEAALGLAYRALVSEDASGIYFALPTQLTSTRLYDRFLQYVSQISPHQENSVQLIHGGARLHRVRNYEEEVLSGEFGKEAAPGGTWFSATRRAILASFGVGTIDQALLSELSGVRFSCVRAAGLFGKVVIFDEVHSYDTYTSTLLKNLLQRLVKLGAVVIVLSATLTTKAREFLLGCAESALETASSPIAFTRKLAFSDVVTTEELPIRKEDSRHVTIKLLEWEQTSEAFDEALRRVKRGEQVLWIENDVKSAQRYWERFKAENVDCGLIHSRFRPVERESLENKWTQLFGKFAGAERNHHGRILIGTQILEQSLDIDADFLVTRLAPIDLLIQRMGRLWRHQKTIRPKACSVPCAWVLAGPTDGTDVTERTYTAQFGASAYVYSPPYFLYRTLEMLKRRLREDSRLQLPDEVRRLLEDVYQPRSEESNPEVEGFRQALQEHRAKLEALSKGVLSFVGAESDSSADPSTRYIDRPTYEVLVVTSLDEFRQAPKPQAEAMIWAERRIVKINVKSKLPLLRDLSLKNCEFLERLQQAPRFRHVFFLDASLSSICMYTKEEGLLRKEVI